MTALTRREQRLLLAALGGGDLAGILVDDDGIGRLRASWLGGHLRHVCSHAAGDSVTFFQVGGRGIAFGRIERESVGFAPSETITWAGIRAHRATLPARVIDEIRATRNAARVHHHAYPTFEKPDDPAEFADAHIAFQRDAVEPWAAEMARLYDARKRAVLAAFPAAIDDEPADLFEVLALIEGGRP